MTRYLRKGRLYILHIPRTGGTWVERALEMLGLERLTDYLSLISPRREPQWLPRKHRLLQQNVRYYKQERIAWNDIACVAAFVRHPLPYYESVWRWLMDNYRVRPRRLLNLSGMKGWTWHPHATTAARFEPEFNTWVRRTIDEEPLWYTRLVEQYVGPGGGEVCDFIGRTETLEEDFCRLVGGFPEYRAMVEAHRDGLRALGTGVNRSETPRPEWEDEVQEAVLWMERAVVERFYGANEGRRLYGRWASSVPCPP